MRSWFKEFDTVSLPFETAFQKKKKEDIKISIGIITFQRSDLLADVLSIIIPQLSNQAEAVIVIDGPDPDTDELLTHYQHPQLQVVRHRENRGRPSARNSVVQFAVGEYILWVDDDDLPSTEIVSYYLKFINQSPDTDVAYTDLEVVDLETGKNNDRLLPEDVSGYKGKFLQNLVLGRGLTSIGALVRRSLYLEVGGFDLRFKKAQDAEFWFRIAQTAKFKKMPKILYCYRRNPAGISYQKRGDYSYISFAIRNCLRRIPLDEIFPEYNWEDCKTARARAIIHIATGMMNIGDVFNGNRFLDCIPVEELTPTALGLSVRSALVSGRISQAQGFLNSSRGLYPDSRIDLHRSLKILIEDVKDIELLIIESYQNKKNKELARRLKSLHQLLGPTYLTSYIYSKRFQNIGDHSQSRAFLEIAFRYNPLNEELFQSMLESSRNTSQKEEFLSLKQRMLGEEPDAPLFFLSSEGQKMRQIFKFDYYPSLEALPSGE